MTRRAIPEGVSWRHERRLRAVGACDTGTCRDDPIPPGVYWLDVPWEEALQTPGVTKPVHFALWLDAMRATGWVKLLSSVHHEGVLLSDDPPRDWQLFEVLSPAPRWTPQTGLGLPSVAPRGIQTTEDDTITSPDIKGESIWDRILPSSTGGKLVVIAAGVGIAVLIINGVTRG